jgi:DNA-binding protein YbaB
MYRLGPSPDRLTALREEAADAAADLLEAEGIVARMQRGFATIKGVGKAEKGAVTVTVDASGRLIDIEFTPAALRLGSLTRLTEAILDANDDAVDDAAGKLRAVTGVESDAVTDPLADFLGAMPEVTDLLPAGLRARLEGRSVVDGPARAARRATNEMWEGPNPYE